MIASRRGLFYGFLTLYVLEALNRTFTEAMLVMALPLLANSLTQPFIWGPLSDRLGRRKIFIALGETVAGLAYIILSPPVWSLFTGFIVEEAKTLYAYSLIAGLTILESLWSMSNVGWSALLADLTEPENRGVIMGQLSSVAAVGRIVGVFIGGILYDYPKKAEGFPYLFYVSSIIMFSSALIILLTVEEERGRQIHYKRKVEIPISEFFPEKTIFYVFLVSIMFWSIALASTRRILNYYLRLALLATSLEISIISNVSSLTQLLVNPIIGKLSDVKGRIPLLQLGFGLAILVPILYTLPQSIILLIPVSVVAGITSAISMTVTYAYVADIIPEEVRGRYFGRYNMIRSISFGVIPIITAGILADIWAHAYISEGLDTTVAQINAMVNVFYLSAFIALFGFTIFQIHNLLRKRRRTK